MFLCTLAISFEHKININLIGQVVHVLGLIFICPYFRNEPNFTC